jgi:predicted transcriptional regulator of viral defense system
MAHDSSMKDQSRQKSHYPKPTGHLYRTFQHERIVHRKDIISCYEGNAPLANLNIQRLLKSKRAIRVKTGVYYFKRPNEFYDDLSRVNPILVAGKVHPEGFVVYHTALRLVGEAYSESRVFQVGVPGGVRRVMPPFEFQNAEYRFYRVDDSFGVTTTVIEDVKIRHLTKERILLEGLMHSDRFFGMPEFLKSIEGFKWVDVDTLAAMLSHYPIPTAAMRLGWLLERFRESWYIKEDVLRSLERYRTMSRLFLIPGQRRGNKLSSRWNLMVPKTLDHLEGS